MANAHFSTKNLKNKLAKLNPEKTFIEASSFTSLSTEG
jgi:hypothetical protein